MDHMRFSKMCVFELRLQSAMSWQEATMTLMV